MRGNKSAIILVSSTDIRTSKISPSRDTIVCCSDLSSLDFNIVLKSTSMTAMLIWSLVFDDKDMLYSEKNRGVLQNYFGVPQHVQNSPGILCDSTKTLKGSFQQR